MKIKEIIECLENTANPYLQEDYDNSGLILGDAQKNVDKVLICLDVTEAVIKEAIKKKCNLIVSHHPVVFSGLKRITADNITGKLMMLAIKNDIAIYAYHTNFDAVDNGINSALCGKLGLKNCSILKPSKNVLRKLITFCPNDKAELVRQAMFEAGAGHIGNYDSCSYNVEGYGTFRGLENANPYVGKKFEVHKEAETRIEVIYPVFKEKALLDAMKNAHPYEEVAYDIYPLANDYFRAGSGMIGELTQPLDTGKFLVSLKKTLKLPVIRHSEIISNTVRRVAVCGGSGTFLLKDAIQNKADIFLTGDIRYHQFAEPSGRITLADIGHYESECTGLNNIAAVISEKFPTFAVLISENNTNFVHYI